jgi:hypothetical protein
MGRKTGLRIVSGLIAALATASLIVAVMGDETATDGRDTVTLAAQTSQPGIEAYSLRESYRPGDAALIVVETPLRTVRVQVFRIGDVPGARHRYELRGTAVTSSRAVALRRGYRGREARVAIGDWPTGMYYVELRAGDGRIGYVPFVVAPGRLGEHRVAVVMPTNTWFAYNRHDADGDGAGDTWYEDRGLDTIDMKRPFLDRGVPPYFGKYDFPFLRWLHRTGKEVDVLSQRELEQVAGGDVLARAYDLIVFPGHHEYVTPREYDAVERYRDLGGNLMFLSANNFFYKVTKQGDGMTRHGRWRDYGRPEAALIGVQYIGNDEGEHRGPFTLRRAPALTWIFAGTGFRPGSRFADFGIEIDHTAPSSPPGTQVLGEIPDLLGPGQTAQMTYYETAAGAEVFAAGAFTLAGAALWPAVSPVLENLWARLTTA